MKIVREMSEKLKLPQAKNWMKLCPSLKILAHIGILF